MSFETFARVALERGDTVRAMLILIEGLKRHPDHEQALALLVNLYGAHSAPGLERDVVAACATHPEAPYILGQLMNRLEARGMLAMAGHIEQAADRMGIPIELIEEDDPDSDLLTLSQLEALIAEAEAVPFVPPDGFYQDDQLDPDEQPTLPPGARPQESEPPSDAPVFDTDPPGVWSERFEPSIQRAAPPAVPARASNTPQEADAPRDPRRRTGLRALMLVVLVGACTGLGWLVFARSAADVAQERHVELYDPLMPTAYEVARQRAEERWGARSDEAGCALFVEALGALERGQAPPIVGSPVEHTAWGVGAQALFALQSGDQVHALTHLARLERQWPDALATLWTRARVEESRGQMTRALTAYQRVIAASPRFLPALVGAIRTAYAIGDQDAAQRHQRQLFALNPAHPYLSIAPPAPLTSALWQLAAEAQPARRAAALAQPDEASDAYLRALTAHQAALAAWQRGELEEAWSWSQRAVSGAPWTPEVVTLHAALLAARGQVEAADEVFARLASAQGLPVARRLELMWIAPRALAAAGRPDLGWRWTLATPQLAAERPGPDGAPAILPPRVRPVALSLTTAQLDAAPRELVMQAGLARASTLRAWGKGEHALDVLEQLEAHSGQISVELLAAARLERGLALVESGRLEQAAGLVAQMGDEPLRHVVEAQAALAAGEVDRAVRAAELARTARPSHAEVWRVWLTAQAAAGHLEEAQAALVSRRLAPSYAPWLGVFDGLLRAGLAPAPRDEAMTWTAPGLLAVHAQARLLAGDDAGAIKGVERALALAPASPEVAQIGALVARATGHQERASALLSGARLGAQAELRLWMELGNLWNERGRWTAAREAFEQVLAVRPNDEAALWGLVRACEGVGAACREALEGRWASAQGDARRAGALARGLAVLSGSRSGSAEGLAWLERARRHGQDEPALLVEFGAYWRALGQEERARKAYLDALLARESCAPAHLGLARIALKAKQMPQAHEHLTRYLALSPRGADADWARRQLGAR
jgi:tetratricopeptide (TPR) repeat protein